jgi:antitoxin VapB
VALNIKDTLVDRLAKEVAALSGESKTGAIRTALLERKERLAFGSREGDRAANVRAFLEQEVWPQVPKAVRGKRLSKRDRERILGYGPHGV